MTVSWVRDMIDIVQEELDAVLGAAKSGRVGETRHGYRHRARASEDFDTWRSRDLADEDIRYVFLDSWFPKVRIGARRTRVLVLVTLGVRAGGQRVILDLRLAGEESAASWGEVVASVIGRHLRRPRLAVIDGNPRLAVALHVHWPGLAIQRCPAHTLRNLEAKAPALLGEELIEDDRRMIYAETVTAVEKARARFTKKWRRRCPAVVSGHGGDAAGRKHGHHAG